jgi:hypothetical protein
MICPKHGPLPASEYPLVSTDDRPLCPFADCDLELDPLGIEVHGFLAKPTTKTGAWHDRRHNHSWIAIKARSRVEAGFPPRLDPFRPRRPELPESVLELIRLDELLGPRHKRTRDVAAATLAHFDLWALTG